MPTKPRKFCSACGIKHSNGGNYCTVHMRLSPRSMKRADPFYTSRLWRRTRSYHIQREPLCRECKNQGINTPGEHVDHIKPIKQGGHATDSDNLQTLCASCHSKKTRTEQHA